MFVSFFFMATGNETDQYIFGLYNYYTVTCVREILSPSTGSTPHPETNDASSPGVYFLRRGPSSWQRDVHGRVWGRRKARSFMLLYNVGCNNTRQLYNENFKNSPEIRSKYFSIKE